MSYFRPQPGDSARGQGSRSDQSSIGLSLRPGGIATTLDAARSGAHLPLNRFSANGTSPSTPATAKNRAQGRGSTKHVIAPQVRPFNSALQGVNGIKP